MQLLNKKLDFIAGSPINLVFNKTTDSIPNLYCSSSYGNILISPTIKNNELQYLIPDFISQKSGYVYWQLTQEFHHLKGSFYIHPTNKINNIETYLGPPSIEAGEVDYAMLVTIPLDNYNNPVAKNTPVIINTKHLSNTQQKTIPFDGMIAYQKIYSNKTAGRSFISTNCLNQTSKEYTLEIVPASPTNFNIDSKRVHDFGDGNQVTQFYTSKIKDRYNNIVADGTSVTFRIENDKKMYLQTFGTTINGIATAKMVHPDHSDTWNIQAFVDGFAVSNTISLTYKNAVKDFNIEFKKDSKHLVVGPFKSFMQQTLPDGLMVKISLFENEKIIQKINSQTEDGFSIFDLHTFLKKNKNYNVKIEAAQISKQLEIKL
ncbi:hypothetical protein AXE80_11685 [Wenyingzhuangia fucanilytica]|uniref:Uncharacterized protein n=1 Tax=Wenyingzhuangia fucanilytica TaxID=1790137 RepID=A0A1B1Y839_9FLAO|nr:hypothetical protein [Wenyingzhuangia fucanilytica]ANW96904.1 hypothetical protein AXE80_11685 [Wenyingzhuangia fucanilytica]